MENNPNMKAKVQSYIDQPKPLYYGLWLYLGNDNIIYLLDEAISTFKSR